LLHLLSERCFQFWKLAVAASLYGLRVLPA